MGAYYVDYIRGYQGKFWASQLWCMLKLSLKNYFSFLLTSSISKTSIIASMKGAGQLQLICHMNKELHAGISYYYKGEATWKLTFVFPDC